MRKSWTLLRTSVLLKYEGFVSRACPIILLSLVTSVYSVSSEGQEQWLCTEAASVKSGNIVTACGVGTGLEEHDARMEALKQAKKEFEEICNDSADCKNRKLIITPLRNSCEKTAEGSYKCYRGIKCEITETVDSFSFLKEQKQLLEEEQKLLEERLLYVREIREQERTNEKLREQIANPEYEEDNHSSVYIDPFGSTVLFQIGTGLASPKTSLEFVSWTILELSFVALISPHFGLSAGGTLDMGFYHAPDPVFSTIEELKTPFGFSGYVSIPFYVKHYLDKSAALFIAPEYALSKLESVRNSGFGLSIGWQGFPAEQKTSEQYRLGVIGLGANTTYVYFVASISLGL